MVPKERSLIVSDNKLFRWLPLGSYLVIGANGKLAQSKPSPAHDEVKARALLEDIRQANPNKSQHDIHWIFIDQLARQDELNYFWQSQIHHAKALYLNFEEQNPFGEMANSRRMELKHYQHSGADGVQIISSQHCEKCQILNGMHYTFGEALSKMPLPNPGCISIFEHGKFPFCRCSWSLFYK